MFASLSRDYKMQRAMGENSDNEIKKSKAESRNIQIMIRHVVSFFCYFFYIMAIIHISQHTTCAQIYVYIEAQKPLKLPVTKTIVYTSRATY